MVHEPLMWKSVSAAQKLRTKLLYRTPFKQVLLLSVFNNLDEVTQRILKICYRNQVVPGMLGCAMAYSKTADLTVGHGRAFV